MSKHPSEPQPLIKPHTIFDVSPLEWDRLVSPLYSLYLRVLRLLLFLQIQNLNQNQNIKKIVLHFDNDSAGRIATMALKTILPKQYEVVDDPPKVGKDFNDFLCDRVGINYKKRYGKER